MNHVTGQIDLYLVDALDAADRDAFEMHLGACEPCAAALAEARRTYHDLNALFSSHQPDPHFEERMIHHLRKRQSTSIHPLVRKAAMGIAASILLGGIGYGANVAMDRGKLPMFSFLTGENRNAARVSQWGLAEAPPLSFKTARVEQQRPMASASNTGVMLGDGDVKSPLSRHSGEALGESVQKGHLFDFRTASGQSEKALNAMDFADSYLLPTDNTKIDAIGWSDDRDKRQDANSPSTPPRGNPSLATADARKEPEAVAGVVNAPDRMRSDGLERNGATDKQSAPVALAGESGSKVESELKDSPATPPPSTPTAAPTVALEKQDKDTPPPGQQPAQPQNGAPNPADQHPGDPHAGDQTTDAQADSKPKIIRTGEMDFEVDSFDSAVNTINKVVTEEMGYVSTTNSDKLPNGKVAGSVVLRVPADHLDTLVLKLRGIGDLRTQHINAQDITKQFTDTQSALRAAQAMQERLLDIIKNGKGSVKDLLEAEKQLGVWREKVEQLEGEIRYYSNQVAMSTLTLALAEHDIRTPATASETETVTLALETEKVDEAYAKAKDAIAAAKGRIINSELKQYDAGQFGGTIVAQIPPDAADEVIGRLKQIDGRIARFERQRNQTTSNGESPVDARPNAPVGAMPMKVKREDVTLNLTLYNLANIGPRRQTTMTVVADDVEQAYHGLIEQVRAAGGRIVTSQINRQREDQMAGLVTFTLAAEKSDMMLAALRNAGEVLKTETTESPDTQNVTESKRGFSVTLGSRSAFAARETRQVQLAAASVRDAFNELLNAVHARSGRVMASQLNETDQNNSSATLEFDLPRDADAPVQLSMDKQGDLVSRTVNRSVDTENTVDSKIHVSMTIVPAERLNPRQTTELAVEVSDVQKAMDDLQAAALLAGGKQVDTPAISQSDNGQTTATLTLNVPLDRAANLVDSANGMGVGKARRTSIDAAALDGKLARARLTVTFTTPTAVAGAEDGLWAGIRRGLGASVRGLSYSLTLIVIGLCLVAPWALLVGVAWRGIKWAKRTPAA